MSECSDCRYDDVGDLEYCIDHRPDITCRQCNQIRPIYFESDYDDIMETGDTICLSCAVDNRIEELRRQQK